MTVRSPSLRLIIDSIALIISIAVIQYCFAYISFEQYVNLERIAFNSVVGFLMYFIPLCVFTELGRNSRLLPTLYSVTVGSFLWNVYYSILMIQADWSYLCNNPEAFYHRHLAPDALAFGVLVPLFTGVSVGIILLARFLAGSKTTPDRLDFN